MALLQTPFTEPYFCLVISNVVAELTPKKKHKRLKIPISTKQVNKCFSNSKFLFFLNQSKLGAAPIDKSKKCGGTRPFKKN